MTRVRLLTSFLVGALLLTSCSIDAADVVTAQDGRGADGFGQTAREYDEVVYCTELQAALLLGPEGNVADGDLAAFADALERAAAVSTPSHEDTLRDLAEMNRDPDSVTVGDGFLMLPRLSRIYEFAHEQCGMQEAPGVRFEEDGSVVFSGSGSVSVDFSTSSGSANGSIPNGPGSQPPLDLSAPIADRLARLNEQVAPNDLRFELVNVSTDDDEPEYDALVAVPDDWPLEQQGLFGVSADGDPSSFGTEMVFSSNCQGSCTAQDWTVIMDDPELSPFALSETPEFELLLIQRLSDPPGRLLVRELAEEDTFDGKVQIVVTRWHPEADHFFTCEAELREEIAFLWREFAHACVLADPAWIP